LCKLKLKKDNILNQQQDQSDHAYPNRCGEDVEMQIHATNSMTMNLD
jgi:hypothetical protein